MSTSIDILDEETCDYYYGNISRETAEYILWDKGCLDSLFLIRKSNSDYVLSLCYQKSILHYRISYLGNGEVMLHGLEAQKFSSIENLLEGVEGLAIKPTLPCERSSGWQLPPTYWGLTVGEIRSAIIKKSHEWGFTQNLVTFPIEYLSLGNDDYNRCILTEVTKSLINKTLHEIQPWFHGRLTRLEAEKSLEESGHKEGKFLVRERDAASYALCVSHEGTAKHYRIDILSSGELAIQDGHKFPSIMSLVSHYTVFTDGLWTSLGEPCPRFIHSNSSFLANGEIILQSATALRHGSGLPGHITSVSSPNNSASIGLMTGSRRNHLLHNHHNQQFSFRSPSSERNQRNLINNSRGRGLSSHTSVKLKEWLSTINHKWSQLISAVTPRHPAGDTGSANNRLGHHCRGHHFSTLPRNHLLLNHPRANFLAQQSLYDYAGNGHQNSLNFRSLNVEINSPWINPNHNFLLNRNHPSLIHSSANSAPYESHHYQETDLFPKNVSNNINNNSNVFETIRNVKQVNEPVPQRRVSFADNCELSLAPQQPPPSLVVGTLPIIGQTNGGSNNGTGLYLARGNIKSSSLEDLYSTSSGFCRFDDDRPLKNEMNIENESNNENNTPPLPVPRKSKPNLGITKDIIQYANQEIIKLHKQLSSDDSNESADDDIHRIDLLSFEEIQGNGPNDLVNSSERQIKTLIELITEGYFNESFRTNGTTFMYINNNNNNNNNTVGNNVQRSEPSASSSNNSNNVSVSQTASTTTVTTTAPYQAESCLNSNVYACSIVQQPVNVRPNEPLSQSETVSVANRETPNSLTKEETKNSDNPNYEEINEDMLKEIELTRPSLEVLREFDSCFSVNSDKRRSSEPVALTNNGSSEATSSTSSTTCNGRSLQSTTTHWTSIDGAGVIPMYDYDALKFDRDLIVKEASLGLTSLVQNQSGSQVKLNELDLICLEEDPEEVNKSVTRYRQGPISLDPKFITLQKPLGNGYFGEVYLGTIPSQTGTASIQVAVKVLKLSAIPNHKSEILREAQTMSALDHKHIVRLIGVCESDPIMIVMELAPLGPLNQYLIEHGFTVTIKDIIALLLQVAMAMQYLESKQFIHRDLAARNVLLVNEKFAKVSDFGMSRALGIGKEYYKAKSASKWPLKWYAPECIYYFKFSTKSDVWSYGVTMWESLSYGQKPYEGMDGQDILKLFRENRRLPKPDNCPQEIYQLMWKCWQFRPEDRPTFSEICQTMTTYFLCSNI